MMHSYDKRHAQPPTCMVHSYSMCQAQPPSHMHHAPNLASGAQDAWPVPAPHMTGVTQPEAKQLRTPGCFKTLDIRESKALSRSPFA